MKKPVTSILTVLCLIILASASAQAAPKKIQVGHDLWIGYSGVFIAKDKGYFDEAGLDVQFKPFSSPGETLAALATGNLDIGLTTLHNLTLLDGTADIGVSLVYLIDSSNGADAIVAKNEITSVEGLKGKQVAATTGEVNEMLLVAGLEKAGLKESDIQLVNMSPDDAGAAFVAGKLDAAVTWEPWVTKARSGAGHVVFSSAEIPDTILDCIAVPKQNIAANAKDLAGFVKAVDRGVQFLHSNPDEAKKIIAKYLSVTPEEVQGMLDEDKIYSLADNKKLLADGGPGFKSLQRDIDFATQHKLVQKKLVPSALIDTEFVAP
jgi:NitT/TauT family transport system substrate-binding protein